MKRLSAISIGFFILLAGQLMPLGEQGIVLASTLLSDRTEDLGAGLYAYRSNERRSFFLISAEGVIVIDPLNESSANSMRKEITKLSDLPVKYVVYTNSFYDRSSGGKIFKDEGATFVAHEECLVELTETPNPNVVMPDVTFQTNYTITLGEQTLDLHHYGPSYGLCFTVAVPRPANIMILSDVISPPSASLPRDPTIANYNLYVLMDFFDQVEALAVSSNIKEVAAGYAPLGKGYASTSPVSLISEQRRVWEVLLDEVEIQYNKKFPARVIPERMDMSRFEDFVGFEPKYIKIMSRRVYSLYRIGRR
ncbi:MAG: hypothetical protein VYA80_00020 [Pseudomonadota bacterium]|nr:hypothetical protein [Pseudomonadota bacterium]